MFGNFTDRILNTFDSLTGKGLLTEEDVSKALREIRIAMLEADVPLSVAKDFVEGIKEKAVGERILKSVKPGDMVVKIVRDSLADLLGKNLPAGAFNLLFSGSLSTFLLIGLQGSGKTTTAGKLSLLLKNDKKKVLLSSLDIYRPAAQEQLLTLGTDNTIAVLPKQDKKKPLEIAKIAKKHAEDNDFDVLILDSAGRNHVDKKMMLEIQEISKFSSFTEIFFISDSLTGQDAVNTATSFSEKVDLTGIILTRLDGDGRGGAALSMKETINKPIKFIGVGEKIDDFEVFHPDRIANRILGMGDVVSLVEKASEQIDKEDAEKLQKKILKGKFSLADYSKQLDQLTNMGGIQGFLKYLPGMSGLKEKVEQSMENSDIFKKQKAIISSMTKKEKNFPDIVKASRKIRISRGSGTSVQDINKLLKQFKKMSQMMKKMGKNKTLENMMSSGQMGDLQSLLNKNKF